MPERMRRIKIRKILTIGVDEGLSYKSENIFSMIYIARFRCFKVLVPFEGFLLTDSSRISILLNQ